jgi:hypothetical protein
MIKTRTARIRTGPASLPQARRAHRPKRPTDFGAAIIHMKPRLSLMKAIRAEEGLETAREVTLHLK